MFPTRQRAHSSHAVNVNHVVQARAAPVPENRAFHVRGLDLAALHYDFSACGDGALRNVQAVMIIFREAEHNCDFRHACRCAYAPHFR
jgi:hypothetical protein